MEVKVYGCSDDTIRIDGDIRDEFEAYDEDKHIAVSGGTVLKIGYSDDGTWNIRVINEGGNIVDVKRHEGADSDNYSDVAIIISPLAFEWVVIGEGKFK